MSFVIRSPALFSRGTVVLLSSILLVLHVQLHDILTFLVQWMEIVVC